MVATCAVALVYGERLRAGQLVGGLAVLASVVVLQPRFGQSDTNRRLVRDTRTLERTLHPETGESDIRTNPGGRIISAEASPDTPTPRGHHERPG